MVQEIDAKLSMTSLLEIPLFTFHNGNHIYNDERAQPFIFAGETMQLLLPECFSFDHLTEFYVNNRFITSYDPFKHYCFQFSFDGAFLTDIPLPLEIQQIVYMFHNGDLLCLSNISRSKMSNTLMRKNAKAETILENRI